LLGCVAIGFEFIEGDRAAYFGGMRFAAQADTGTGPSLCRILMSGKSAAHAPISERQGR
jgi:hypothetical protein